MATKESNPGMGIPLKPEELAQFSDSCAKAANICPLWKRISAFLIDFFIIYFTIIEGYLLILSRILPASLTLQDTTRYLNSNPYQMIIVIICMGMIGSFLVLYFTLLEWLTGQTIGKMALNVYVSYTSETKPGFLFYLFSNITFIPLFPFMFLWVIDPLWMIFSKDKQRLMEKISSLIVIEKGGL